MDWAKPKAAAAKLALADSGAAEMAFFLALSLVPFVGVSIVLVSRWIPLEKTLHRRVARRVVLHKVKGLRDYARFLRKNPGEVEALYQDILIDVTSFFRNPGTFEALKAEVSPALFKDRSRHEPLRVWVLGCSTGEEAYSIAITFAELAEARGSKLPVQVFATEVASKPLARGRDRVASSSCACPFCHLRARSRSAAARQRTGSS